MVPPLNPKVLNYLSVASRTRRRPPRCVQGAFMLIDMMMALGLSMLILAGIMQTMLLHSRSAETITTGLRDRINQRRTLQLIRNELNQAARVVWDPSSMEPAGCSLTGRTPLLQLKLPQAMITYSIGPAPSAIWQPQVLMRCGPAYGLDGTLSSGANQHRVVLDRLGTEQASVQETAVNLLKLSLGSEWMLADASYREAS